MSEFHTCNSFSSSVCLLISAVVVVSGIFLLAASYGIAVIFNCSSHYSISRLLKTNLSKQTIIFLINLSLLLVVFKVAWDIVTLTYLFDFDSQSSMINPLYWLFKFLKIDNYLRLKVVCYWVCSLLISIPLAQHKSISKLPCIIRRKYFHLLAVIMFVPPLVICQPIIQIVPFLTLAYSVALAALLYIEALRCYIIPTHSLSKSISAYFSHYLDSRYAYMYIFIKCSLFALCCY